MTTIRNPGYLSDAIFHRDHGHVEEKDSYFLITTPSNPTFHWGNYLIFKSAPTPGCYSDWMSLHAREFGPDPDHVSIGWDSDKQGDISEFEKNGFTLNDGIVLKLSSPSKAPSINPAIKVRKLTDNREWETVIDQQVEDGFEGVTRESYREFKRLQMANYRASQNRGLGHWWGAFLGEQLVGSMGLFFDRKNQLGRFQQVHTVKEHRRQGVCTTLLSAIIDNAFNQEGAKELLIVTDIDSAPERVYRSVGFKRLCPQFGLSKINVA